MQNLKCFYSSPCLYVSKKELWEDNKIKFKKIIHEDEEVILPLVFSANKIHVIDKVYFFRRLRNNSIMTSGKTSENIRSYLVIIESILDYYENVKHIDKFDISSIKNHLNKFIRKYLRLSVELSLELKYSLIIKSMISVGGFEVFSIYKNNYLIPKVKLFLGIR